MGVTEVITAAETDAPAAYVAAVARALPSADFWTMPVLAAVSGGADSVSMLLALHRLVPADALGRLLVVHAEHDLRTDAGVDRAFVEGLAGRLGLRAVIRRLAVVPRRGEGIEAAARRLRHEFFVDAAAEAGGRHVLVAHTADDQAETILHRILRGTGPAGLAGMSPARTLCEGVALLRPLLAVPRDDVRAFLTAEAEAWREDESNADVRHARNFLRHEILARCAAGPYPAVAAALVRLGSQAGRLAA
ncbi:MAG: tRNA lysidine(34) synthetase TilS, partial [Planctomycetota bacterium]